ncbi:ATP-dependent DNA ligase [Streptomonospora sp. S1-112]|uniref:ATP-dependent DNA ligase n=1 Tax=Streptomonospora mangrovi TaxID=2883123 RepID=A0A9X3SGU8_9ACTN|nr:ATP-dependent DNA ligase [Streptomonospora mangrovi]MDA0564554.1 ATP-dependent DNA ligase [Streptomonospora mangrovi]
MLARTVARLPEGPRWRYEPKWDGYRALAERGAERTALTSRAGNSFTSTFPEVAAAVHAALPPGTLVDGEIVRWSPEGRLDFDAVQRRGRSGPAAARRLAATEPCHYIVFDLLAEEGTDLTRRPLDERRDRLTALLRETAQPVLMLGWHTASLEVARQWYAEMPAVGVEGLVVKDGRAPYRPGRREWQKYKRRVTTEAVVGGVTGSPERPGQLVLGRRDSATGELRIVGRTADLGPAERAALSPLLRAAEGDDHPWPAVLPASWGSDRSREYTRVVPEAVVEVAPDTAVSGGRWRHVVRYVRARPDVDAADVPADLDLES